MRNVRAPSRDVRPALTATPFDLITEKDPDKRGPSRFQALNRTNDEHVR